MGKKEEKVKKTLFLFLGVVCILLLSSSIAEAQVKYATVSPCEFVSELHLENQFRIWNWGNYLYPEPTATHRWIYARVDLPEGAIIKWMKVHYYDNVIGPYMVVSLRRANKYNAISEVVYAADLAGSNSTALRVFTDLSPSHPARTLVSLNVFNYYLVVDMSGDGTFAGSQLRLYGVTIGYQ